MKNVAPKLMAGANLASLYALQQFGPEVREAGINLSKIYRQILVAEQVLGFIPEGKYERWKQAYKAFLVAIMKYCFGQECDIQSNLISQI
jgi:hypothetical protein